MSGTRVGQLHVGVDYDTTPMEAGGKQVESNVDTLLKRLKTKAGAANPWAQFDPNAMRRPFEGARLESLEKEAAHLRWSLLTDRQRRDIIRQSDMEHLNMLLQFKAITIEEHRLLSTRAGTLGLGSMAEFNNMRNKGFRGAMIAQQIGFGVQDFMSQMTNAKTVLDGMGRGVMAMSNNVQMMGAAWGPIGLAVTAISGTLIGLVLPPMIAWIGSLETVKKMLGEVKHEIEDIPLVKRKPFGQTGTLEEWAELTGEERRRRLSLMPEKERNADALRLRNEIEALDVELRRKSEAATGRGDAEEAAAIERQRDRLNEMWKDVKQAAAMEQKRLDDAERDRKAKEQGAAIREEAELRDKLRAEEQKRSRDAIRAGLDEQIRAENAKQEHIREGIDKLREQGITPAGPSAMSIAGTSAAASAINRALSGTRSEENDRKRQIKIMEDQLRSSQRIEQKLNLAKADLGAA